VNLKPAQFSSLISAKKKIKGEFVPPPDKSITHRAIFLSSLSLKKSCIKNPLLSADCLSSIDCFKKLGVPIEIHKQALIVSSGKESSTSKFRSFLKPNSKLDCGNSGTTMRLLSGVAAAQNFKSCLTGDSSLSKRPMKRVIEPLTKMGALIQAFKDNYAPLRIKGNPNLKPIDWKSPVASAQVKSSILLAALFASGKTTIEEPVKSRDHTERFLKALGIKIMSNERKVTVWGGGSLQGLDLKVPGDFSSAAFFIAAALLVPDSFLVIKNVNLNPTRTGFLKVLKKMGANIEIKNLKERFNEPLGDLEVRASSLKACSIQREEIPFLIDEIPILAVLATQAQGESSISGAEELRVKESDRIASMASELKKMGAEVEEKKDGILISGPVFLKGTKLNSYQDHRIAMSLAIAALLAEGETKITDFDCVNISFPNFLKELNKLID